MHGSGAEARGRTEKHVEVQQYYPTSPLPLPLILQLACIISQKFSATLGSTTLEKRRATS